jgi:hypothetical protein
MSRYAGRRTSTSPPPGFGESHNAAMELAGYGFGLEVVEPTGGRPFTSTLTRS